MTTWLNLMVIAAGRAFGSVSRHVITLIFATIPGGSTTSSFITVESTALVEIGWCSPAGFYIVANLFFGWAVLIAAATLL